MERKIGQLVKWNRVDFKICAISKSTGSLTIESIQDDPPFKKGEKVIIMPYDLD